MWSFKLTSLGAAATMALSAQVGLASSSGEPRAEREAKQIEVKPTRTGKERLGGKPSDEQRVDNCNVPLELRGPRPRPDDCSDGTIPDPIATRPIENGANPMPAERTGSRI